MAFNVDFAINVMYPAASAAYLTMSVPIPPLNLPAGFVSAGTISANPQDAAAAMKTATADQQRLANKVVTESSIFGLVAWNSAEKTAIIAIRGTETWQEWLADIDAAPMPYLPDPPAGDAHMGFQLVYEHIRKSIVSLLTAQCPGVETLWITGHSLGAALAILAAYEIMATMRTVPVPQLYTFAGPRTCAPNLAANFNANIPSCSRIVNFMDVVPQVPLPPLYEHVGQETLVHGGFRPLDITYAHHLTTYLTGLQKLPKTVVAAGQS